jgi:hypothetical protein
MKDFSYYIPKIKEYLQEFGHIFPYRKQSAFTDLYHWTQQVREGHILLSEKQIEVLNSFGFEWDASRAEWMEFFYTLTAVKKERGSFYIGKYETPLLPLHKWIRYQQRKFKRGTLPKEYVNLLASIDFTFKPFAKGEYYNLWEKNYKILKDFYDRNGHLEIPSTKEYKSIIVWMRKQRSKERKPTAHQKQLLNEIGFKWSNEVKKQLKDRWLEQFQQLCTFKQKYGQFPSPEKKNQQEYKLYKWLDTQRSRQTKGILAKDRLKKLLSLGVAFRKDNLILRDQIWEKRYQELKVFYSKHGHSKVPRSYDQSLFTWTSRQATYIDTLSKEKKAKLLRLRFEFKPSKQRTSVSVKNMTENLKDKALLISPYQIPKL